MTEPLVHVQHVSKKFCRSLRRSLWYGLGDLGSELIGRAPSTRGVLRPDEFWAVQDIDISVSRGECVGLIGRNGAGKTTLLRMLNGLLRPNSGRIEMRGAVGAMIALGSGIKDILTGRENIYCMAVLRGMTRREAARKIDEIIEFADIRDAIDAPVQTYSSGMRTRLNFAVAASLEPDILLLDEVLAVGDAAFRERCYHRMAELRRQTAVIFVSHNMEQVARTCTSAMVLSRGTTVHHGNVDDAIVRYESLNDAPDITDRERFLKIHSPITRFSATLPTATLKTGTSCAVQLLIDSASNVDDLLFKMHFYNSNGGIAADLVVRSSDAPFRLVEGANIIDLVIASLPLRNGRYAVAFGIADGRGDLIVWSYKEHYVAVSGAYVGALADCQLAIQHVTSTPA